MKFGTNRFPKIAQAVLSAAAQLLRPLLRVATTFPMPSHKAVLWDDIEKSLLI
jgi:hypothetical protein